MFIIIFIIAFVVSIIAVVEICKKEYVNAIIAAIFSFGLFCIAGLFHNDGTNEDSYEINGPDIRVPDDFLFLVGNVHLSVQDGTYEPEGKNWEDYELINKLYFLHNVAEGRYFQEAFPGDSNVDLYLQTQGIKEMYKKSVESAKELLTTHAQGYRDLYVKALKRNGIKASSDGTTFILRDKIITDATFAKLRFNHYESDLRLLGFKTAIFKSGTFSQTFKL